MILTIHLISSLILAIILFPFFGFNSFLVLISGFLIDIDHFLYYMFKFKNLGLKKCYEHYADFQKKYGSKGYKKIFRIFHSFELLFILIIVSFFSKAFLLITIGLIMHYILDFINEFTIFKQLQFSYIQWLKNNAKK